MKLTKEIHRAQTDKIIYCSSMAHISINEVKNDDGQYVYDCIWVPVKAHTEAAVIGGLKQELAKQIAEYHASESANSFTIDAVSPWFGKADRAGLYLRFLSERANGKTETTLWASSASFTLEIDAAIKMLGLLEVYASECYDVKRRHLAAASKLSDFDTLLAYDFTTGYPARLAFTSKAKDDADA